MNTATLFHRLVFTQVILGIVAFCMASRNPGLLLVAGAIGAMSWYMTQGPTGRTIPRWLVNVGAMLAVAWLALDLISRQAYVVAAMGHFTMALQLLMLYARKTDREYSQLLVLSLLQMIAASVLSVSMIYGIFLMVYCVVALATVLMFHLTAAADHVHQANLKAASDGPTPPRPAAVAGQISRRHLRWFGLIAGVVCGVVAAAIFTAMPRTGKFGIDLTGTGAKAPAQTGFSTTVRLGAGPIGTGSREPMLNLKLETYGQNVGWENEPWLIRGAALDTYNPENHTWFRSPFALATDRMIDLEKLNQHARADTQRRSSQYTAEIALRDSRQRTIFSVVTTPMRFGSAGFDLIRFESESLREVSFSPIDQQLQSTESIVGSANYRVTWPISLPGRTIQLRTPKDPAKLGSPPGIDELPDHAFPLPSFTAPRTRSWRPNPSNPQENDPARVNRENYARHWDVELPRIRALALKIIREAGYDRSPDERNTPDDLRIAAALSQYLQNRYAYELSNPRPQRGEDPVITFLFDTRRGHCELFAAGLTALCRSVGIPARLITGFRASEFNSLGGYYVVRQSNAHAWTEIDAGPGIGWVTFDATPSDQVQAEHEVPQGLLASIREVYEHIEFAWIKSIVAFDSRTQKKVLDTAAASVGEARRKATNTLKRLAGWLGQLPGRLRMDPGELFVLSLSSLGLVIAGGILLRLYVVRRRRLIKLQLTTLPVDQRRGLGRRLGFYLTMLNLLERHGYHRPAWQTPSSFARELADANPMKFDPVIALTDLFYEVRFGHHELADSQKQLIRAHLKQLEQTIAA